MIAFLSIVVLAAALPVPRPPEDLAATDAAASLRLAAARVNCTATATTGGRILIAGGLKSQHSLTSALDDAELLDPAFDGGKGRVNGPLPLAGSLFSARAFHEAVALKDGRVLLIGGDLAGSVIVFDPAKGARGEFGAFCTLACGPRFGLTATLLKDGRVLIAGGLFANQKPTTRTEILDPVAKRCVGGPDLRVARNSHTATLLEDGRVFIAGGVGQRSTDLFDPVAGTMTRGPDLTTPRDDHRATLLADGRVLITAGQDAKACCLATCEIFDPQAATCTATGSLHAARADHCQVALGDGSVLVLGGEYDSGNDQDQVLASIERFDPRQAVFVDQPPLRVARDDFAALLLADGRICVIGGQTDGERAVAGIEFVTVAANVAAASGR